MVSSLLQKQYFVLPFQFILTNLSLIRMTPFCKYQRKIFIFRGIFNFQINLCEKGILLFIDA
jgi:hypothetical protein